MADNKRLVKLTNRSDGYVGYHIPDMPANYEEDFAPGETKEIEFEVIKKLYWKPGGRTLLEDYFVITDEEVLGELGIVPEPEYFYDKEDVKELLLNGSCEQLEDALDFAPNGVIDLIKTMAVDLEIPDVRKRNLITEKTGLDVNSVINIAAQLKEDKPVEQEKKVRRAEPIKAAEAKPAERKAAPVSSKYTIKK